MLKIYQIGRTAFHLYQQELKHHYESEGESETIRLLSSFNHFAPNSQFLHKTRPLTLTGLLINKYGFSAMSFEMTMRRYVGKPVPIIAYFAEEKISGIDGCSCQKEESCNLQWIQCYGVVKSVSTEGGSDQPTTITINLELITFWRALDPALWVFGGYASTSENMSKLTKLKDFALNNLPCSCQAINDDCKGFFPIQYDSEEWIVKTDYWYKRHINQSCACNKCFGKSFQYVPNTDDGIFVKINGSQEYWNAPPLSIYSLKFVNDGFTIRAGGSDGAFYNKSYDTTFDLASTNFVLANNGYSSIDNEDIIVVGDFSIQLNGTLLKNQVIIRNGEILPIQPVISYPNYFPGMLLNSISGYAVFGAKEHSSIHFFRRL